VSGDCKPFSLFTSYKPRIRKELESYPEIAFSVEEIGDGVLVTFQITEGVTRLLEYIRANPGLRIPDLSKKLHTPAKTIERWIKALRKEQKIIFKGAPKTGGYFAAE
jgi:ATP-dependent DNA helicase RecG